MNYVHPTTSAVTAVGILAALLATSSALATPSARPLRNTVTVTTKWTVEHLSGPNICRATMIERVMTSVKQLTVDYSIIHDRLDLSISSLYDDDHEAEDKQNYTLSFYHEDARKPSTWASRPFDITKYKGTTTHTHTFRGPPMMNIVLDDLSKSRLVDLRSGADFHMKIRMYKNRVPALAKLRKCAQEVADGLPPSDTPSR